MKLAVNLDLAGVGLCMRSTIHELLNFTVSRVRSSVTQTRTELAMLVYVCGGRVW